MTKKSSKPQPWFNLFSSTAVIVGIVVGIGIFRLPPIVAQNSASELHFLLFWVLGGFISLMGALCYAELSSSLPDTGGEYFFLRKAFGPAIGFYLSWARMTVIQTGSIALIAFILGDYATLLLDLGKYSSSIYASIAVVALTGLNIYGTAHSGRTQNVLTSVIVLTTISLALAGLFYSGEQTGLDLLAQETSVENGKGTAGLAMIFVLLSFGGWSEAAYISGETHNAKKNMVRALVLGIIIITSIYLLLNLAYLNVLGIVALQQSNVVGYDLAQAIFGSNASVMVVLIIIVSALSTANVTIITGARTNYSIGRDFHFFKFLGRWNASRNSPINALIFQAIIALVLVGLGAWSKEAISTMVDFTAPVFWLFITLTTLSLFVFRFRSSSHKIAYKVPLYPLPPIIFLAACIYMFYSSLVYTGVGALLGLSVLIVGIPVYYAIRSRMI